VHKKAEMQLKFTHSGKELKLVCMVQQLIYVWTYKMCGKWIVL